MAWIYLLIAALFEIAWTFSLKFLSVSKLKTIEWRGFFQQKENWLILAPFGGYLLFGLGNVIFFSQAIKEIPASTAFALWLGMSLIGLKLIDIYFFKEPVNASQLLFMSLILIGIAGLKRS